MKPVMLKMGLQIAISYSIVSIFLKHFLVCYAPTDGGVSL